MLENEFIFFFNFGIWQIQSESPGKAIHCQDGTVHSALHCAWLATQFMFQLEKYIVEMVCGQWLATQFEADATLEKSHKKCILHSNYLDPSGSKTSLVWKCLSGENVRSVKMFIRWKCSFGENVHSVQGFWPSATHCFDYHTTLLLGSIIPE